MAMPLCQLSQQWFTRISVTSPPDSEPRQGPCHSVSGRRTTEATKANAVSSRSHAVLQVSVERSERTANVVVQMQEGKLKMVDLAGSERAQRTENTGIRLLEGANINRSLLALANCINALNKKTGKGAHVPYRDSKLTRMLKAHPAAAAAPPVPPKCCPFLPAVQPVAQHGESAAGAQTGLKERGSKVMNP